MSAVSAFIHVNDKLPCPSFSDHEVLEKLPPDSEEQQAQIAAIRDEDGYNWG